MGTLSPEILRLREAGVKVIFQDAYDRYAMDAEWQQVATVVETTLPVQNYAWLGDTPTMREFKDRTVKEELMEANYSIADTVFDATLKIRRRDLEDDQYGLINRRVEQLAFTASRHWNKLAFGVLTSGFTQIGYDGQYFFDSDHSEGLSGTQSNVTNAPLSDASLEAARTQMRLLNSNTGEPLDIMPDVLVVGPKLERRAKDLVGSEIVVVHVGDGTAGTGATAATPFRNFFNTASGIKMVVVTSRIRGFEWFLLDTSGPMKPIILQQRSDVPVEVVTDFSEPGALMKEEFTARVRGRYQAGYGMWQTAYGSNASS